MPEIEVTFAEGQLSINPPIQSVWGWSWVVWRFHGLPEGCLPYIKFASGFGPFRSLRSYQGPSVELPTIVSKGHLARTSSDGDRCSYTAMVLQPAAALPVATAQGTIVNLADRDDSSPDVLVTCTYGHAHTGDVKIAVFPDPLRLNEGDTANWKVTGLRDGDFATLQFLAVEGSPDPMHGPFMSVSLLPGEGSDVRATAMGFVAGATAAPRSFTYQIRVRDAAGNLLGGHDPTIDNIGPPIPPPGDDGGH
jgi:hypothetical protein